MFSSVFLVVVALDQVVKAGIRFWLLPSESLPLIDGILHITYVRNTGAAFGLMPGQRILFVATGLLVVIGILIYWWRTRPSATWLVVCLAIMASGAVGNLIDRVLPGGLVTDFIDVFGDLFPVFNIADSSIVVGVAMLFVWVLFGPEPSEDGAADEDDLPGADGAPA